LRKAELLAIYETTSCCSDRDSGNGYGLHVGDFVYRKIDILDTTNATNMRESTTAVFQSRPGEDEEGSFLTQRSLASSTS